MTSTLPHGRGQMMGNISMVIAVAPATGPTLSGLLLQLGSWRYIFAFVLPIALAILALGRAKLRNANEPRPIPLDIVSVPLTVLAFGPLIYGLSLIGDSTVPFWEPMLAIGVGIAGLIGFAARQFVLQSRDRAFLDLRTFTFGTFTVALMMMAIGAGIPKPVVIARNVLRNALITPLTVLGLRVGYLMGGAVVIEMIFNIKGMGQLIFQGITRNDVNIVQGVTITVAIAFIVINLVVDLLYVLVNPRIRSI